MTTNELQRIFNDGEIHILKMQIKQISKNDEDLKDRELIIYPSENEYYAKKFDQAFKYFIEQIFIIYQSERLEKEGIV